MTRSASATDVAPLRHLPTASSIMVVIPAFIAAASSAPDFGVRPDQVADLARDVENLEHADAAAITDAAATLATLGLKIVSPILSPSVASRGSASKSAAVNFRSVLQRSQSNRTSRWAITARKVDFSRKASTPKSMSLGTAAVDVSVCSVVSTR